MDIPPINLFSNRVDPAGVLELIRSKHPEALVETDPEAGQWSSATIVVKKRGLFKKDATLVIEHSADYYTGDGWEEQRNGMLGYFRRFPMEDLQRARVMASIQGFRFSLSCISNPPVWPDEEDVRNDLISAIAHHLEACIFVPGALLDADYRPLATAEGEFDPDAKFPEHAERIKAEVKIDHGPPDGSEDENEEHHLNPPTPERVAARTMALSLVATRGVLETDSMDKPDEIDKIDAMRADLVKWMNETGLDSELEPAERAILDTPVGELAQQDHVNSMWRLEGLAVLCWALKLHDLPAYDEVTETVPQIEATGILGGDRSVAASILENPDLRMPDELAKLGEQLFTLHWRLRDFGIRPVAMDFREFGQTSWFGPLDLSWAKFGDDDLALQGTAIASAEEEIISTCSSIAAERHQAINWLLGHADIYSEVDTAT